MSIITDKQTNPSSSKKTPLIIIVLMVVATILGGSLSWYQYRQHNYNSLKQINTTTALYNHVQADSKKAHFQYEYYYRPECKHCQKMAKENIIPQLRRLKGNLTVVNVDKLKANNQKLANDWFGVNEVNHTPTLVVRSHGHNIYTYAGTNFKIFKQLLQGINPETNHQLVPYPNNKILTYQDEFTHTKSTQPTTMPTDLGD